MSDTAYPIAFEHRNSGSVEFSTYPRDPGPTVQMFWIVNPFDRNCDMRGRCTFTRQDEVMEHDGIAHTVYKDLS